MNTTTHRISPSTPKQDNKAGHNQIAGQHRQGARRLIVAAAALTLGVGSSLANASNDNFNSGHSGQNYNLTNSHNRGHGRRGHEQRGHHRNRRHRDSHSNRDQAYARVIDVQPVYRQVRIQKPQRECWTEYQQHNTYEGQRHNSYDRGSRSSRSSTSPLLGTIVGGVIGSQVGRYTNGSGGSLGGAIAGALIGTAIAGESGSRSGSRSDSFRESRNERQYLTQNGHSRERFDRGARRHSRNQRPPQRLHSTPMERCETRTITTTERQISSYDVTYRFHGRIYHTNTRQHPGDRIAVEVSVRPRN